MHANILGFLLCSLALAACGNHPEEIGRRAGYARHLVVAGDDIYWQMTPGILRTPVGGGKTTEFASRVDATGRLAADEDSVYWIACPSIDDPFGTPMTLQKAPRRGGAVTTLYTGLTNCTFEDVAVHGSKVFWIDEGRLFSMPTDGGVPEVLSDGVYDKPGLAVDASGIYCPGYDGIVRIPLEGGPATPLAPRLERAIYDYTNIAVDEHNVYWIGVDGVPGLRKAPKNGGAVTTLAAVAGLGELAVDGSRVYWDEIDQHSTVMAVDIGGGPAVTIASVPDEITGIAVDATAIYWTEGSGAVVRLLK